MQMILPSDSVMQEGQARGEAEPRQPYLEAEPLELDFGNVNVGQVCERRVVLRSSNIGDVSLSSSLFQIIFFKDGKQELEDLGEGQDGEGEATASIFFRPDRPGPQEKYI